MSQQTLLLHLKEQFLTEFNLSERMYFLKKAREAIFADNYAPGEDLYHYCYFLTQRKRIEEMEGSNAMGVLRYLVVEGRKDIDDAIRIYKSRLEKNRRSLSRAEGDLFLSCLEDSA